MQESDKNNKFGSNGNTFFFLEFSDRILEPRLPFYPKEPKLFFSRTAGTEPTSDTVIFQRFAISNTAKLNK